MKIEIDVKLDKKSLGQFLLYHNYARVTGIIGVLLSVGAAVALVVRWNFWTVGQKGVLVLLALLFTALQPLILVSKGKRQLQAEEFQIPFHYRFDEKGVAISQGEQSQEFEWRDIRKIVYRKDAVYVYMSTVSAFIIPKEQCGGQFDELANMMKEKRGK